MGQIENYLVDVHGLERSDARVRETYYLKASVDDRFENIQFSLSRGDRTEGHVDVTAKSRHKALSLVSMHLDVEKPDHIEDEAADLMADYRVHFTISH